MPDTAEIEAAVRRLQRLRDLIFFEAHVSSNFGFGATISFNAIKHSNGPNYIEVSLAEATLTLEPEEAEGWSWSDHIKDLVKGSDRAISVKDTRQENRTSNSSATSRTQAHGEVKSGIPLLSGTLGGSQGFDVQAGRQATRGESLERGHIELEHLAQISRPDGGFALRLTSPDGDDLIRFNPHLDRAPFLHPPDPGALKAEDVRVIAEVQPRGENRHALRLLDAGGSWRRANETRNKQVISELLLGKALRQQVRLWPKGRRRK